MILQSRIGKSDAEVWKLTSLVWRPRERLRNFFLASIHTSLERSYKNESNAVLKCIAGAKTAEKNGPNMSIYFKVYWEEARYLRILSLRLGGQSRSEVLVTKSLCLQKTNWKWEEWLLSDIIVFSWRLIEKRYRRGKKQTKSPFIFIYDVIFIRQQKATVTSQTPVKYSIISSIG